MQEFISPTPQSAPAPQKYGISYGNNGNILYGGKTIGNLLYTDLIDVGEDQWLENWAKKSGIKLTPNVEWLSHQGKQKNFSPKNIPLQQNGDRINPSEQTLINSLGISSKERNQEQPQESSLSGLKQLMPLNSPINLRGLNEIQKWQDNVQGYGKGFELSALNSFFRK